MTAPNIVNVTTITGRTSAKAVGTTPTTVVSNSASSGMVLKVNAVYASNVDGVNNADITLDIYRDSTAYHITKTVVVPADSTLDILSKAIYLEEGDMLRATANATGDIQVVCSYEEIS